MIIMDKLDYGIDSSIINNKVIEINETLSENLQDFADIIKSKNVTIVDDNLSLNYLSSMVDLMQYEFTLDEAYLNANATFLNHTKKIITGYNNSTGISIVGRPSGNGKSNPTILLRCDIKIDFTNVREVYYYAMKGANHGTMDVSINDGLTSKPLLDNTMYGRKYLHYNNFPTTWTKYSINTMSIVGEKTMTFMGGWYDNTGYTTSDTRYSHITLVYDK
jgi:hypothetical protein